MGLFYKISIYAHTYTLRCFSAAGWSCIRGLLMIEVLQQLLELRKRGGSGVLVTVAAKEGHSPARLQSKMLLAEGQQWGTVGGGAIELLAREQAEEVLKKKAPVMLPYRLSTDMEPIKGQATGMVCGGVVTLFFEYIGPAEQACIFGAGHIGQALSRLLLDMGYEVTVVDSREEQLVRLDGRCHIVGGECSAYPLATEISEGSYAVISTHSHALDYEVVRAIAQAKWPLVYLGMIASHVKRDTILGTLPEPLRGWIDPQSLYTPCGLNIGGKSPVEIALSVAAEMQSVRYGRGGQKHMRDREKQ